MGLGAIISIGWTLLTRGGGGGFRDTATRLASLLVDLKDAESDVAKAEIERDIVQLKAIADLQRPQAFQWWSPMQLGQYLIVIPYGLWWAAVFLVSISKPLILEGRWTIDDVPPHIFEQAQWLIPVIVAGTILERRA